MLDIIFIWILLNILFVALVIIRADIRNMDRKS